MSLAIESRMSVIQVSNWFANARRRLKKERKALCCTKKENPSAEKRVIGAATEQFQHSQQALQGDNQLNFEPQGEYGGDSNSHYV